MRPAILIVSGFVALYSIELLLVSCLHCVPLQLIWNLETEGYCVNEKAVWFTNAAIHIVSNIAIFILPIPGLKHLQLPRAQKYGLVLVFFIGFFVCIVSIIRLPAIAISLNGFDLTYNTVAGNLWSSLEINTGIICSCFLPLYPMFSRRSRPVVVSSEDTQNSNRPLTQELRQASRGETNVDHCFSVE
jgi:hypothetical protein